MNVLVVGGGAREHALLWKLAASSRVGRLCCAPGNAGTELLGENLSIAVNDFDGLARAVEARGIDLVVVGPEDPLSRGLADFLQQRGHLVFGPTAAAAQIESSKAWAKEIMTETGVPTARAVVCHSAAEALDAVYDAPLPLVIKADGLAAGKGVVVCQTRDEADTAVRWMMEDGALGGAARTLLVEECLNGVEVSCLAVTDGETVLPLLPACDYKRIHDGDLGPNTGGMGAYSPPGFLDDSTIRAVLDDVIAPVIQGMARREIVYRGVLYAGLMMTRTGPKVIEFNCRLGDPETQVILPLLDSDLLTLCEATARGELASHPGLAWFPGACVGVVLASGGYPGPHTTGHVIHGLDAVPGDAVVFHAGTTRRGHDIVTAGGRVLTAVGHGADMTSAREAAYDTAREISFADMHYRSDIALRELEPAP
ncbi:MAG TPA: phosphoribosylamine--glycine ligase [Thermomicrobiales bacterium]|nr:phosphoribosylamine--glycine ligase [Thermomicrobiales bacterium]